MLNALYQTLPFPSKACTFTIYFTHENPKYFASLTRSFVG